MLSYIVFVALLASAHSSTLVKRMVNAEPANIEDYPYLVFLGSDTAICNGAIISKYHVLTAAHCVREDKDRLFIRAGSNYRGWGGSVHRLESVTLHEKFSVDDREQRSSYDIAVVKVKEPFVFNDTCRPIELAEPDFELKVDEPARAAGWGKNEYSWFDARFNKLDFHIVDKAACNETFESWDGLLEGQFCATSDNQKEKYICHGDSGSPLVVGHKVVGVTIYGGGCELDDSPAVYSEVSFFRKWIDQYVEYEPAYGSTKESSKKNSSSAKKSVASNKV